MAGEQSTGTFLRVPGETDEHRPQPPQPPRHRSRKPLRIKSLLRPQILDLTFPRLPLRLPGSQLGVAGTHDLQRFTVAPHRHDHQTQHRPDPRSHRPAGKSPSRGRHRLRQGRRAPVRRPPLQHFIRLIRRSSFSAVKSAILALRT